MVKNPPANAGSAGSFLESGRSPGVGDGINERFFSDGKFPKKTH